MNIVGNSHCLSDAVPHSYRPHWNGNICPQAGSRNLMSMDRAQRWSKAWAFHPFIRQIVASGLQFVSGEGTWSQVAHAGLELAMFKDIYVQG